MQVGAGQDKVEKIYSSQVMSSTECVARFAVASREEPLDEGNRIHAWLCNDTAGEHGSFSGQDGIAKSPNSCQRSASYTGVWNVVGPREERAAREDDGC